MDPLAAIFVLLVIMLLGGIVLLFPLSRQLARYLESRLKAGASAPESLEAELRELRLLVEGLDDRLRGVAARQEFVEKVLESRATDPLELPR